MSSVDSKSPFYREYHLPDARAQPTAREPSQHQTEALRRMGPWFTSHDAGPRGGVLVIPTGGGKTFTATHFLCKYALSDGYKVLWLAHTHHLLEQAVDALGKVVGLIPEPKQKLNARVASGTPGHFKVAQIRSTDDVLISTLQTMANAVTRKHDSLAAFLNASKGRLAVVFDEAHHAPAPSYRQLLVELRTRFPQLRLLGLTATPTHTDARKLGWFHELFPQGILCEVSPHKLMADKILAKPNVVEVDTRVAPAFDDTAYRAWVGTNRDLPEEIIALLAKNQARNDMIGQHYIDNLARYGKTIIFADRWAQCEYIASWLSERGVKAGAVYTHVDLAARTVEARRRRTADENAKIIGQFRRGELDVLLNVRMLTEGTDVPDVKTVFLTRQTTSQILLTQMVGRALRGPRFGGTEDAYLVSFIDQWRHRINWAGFEQFAPGALDESAPTTAQRPPLHLISIELVRRLARQMNAGPGAASSAVALLPLGWYRVEYDARVPDSDDVESVNGFVVVFTDEREAFERFVSALRTERLSGFEDETIELDKVRGRVEAWESKYFPAGVQRIGSVLAEDLFRLARHTAHNDGVPPPFFAFEARDQHDLDAIATKFISADYSLLQTDRALRVEYDRNDRYWRSLYRTYDDFKQHFNRCAERVLTREHVTPLSQPASARYDTPEALPQSEPDDALKEQVRARDRYHCLCCDRPRARARLHVDHVVASYHGGPPSLQNLQTLCSVCNRAKGMRHIDFRVNRTPLASAPDQFALVLVPSGPEVRTREAWQACLRASINLFYQCAAVTRVETGLRGEYLRNWRVELFAGNDSSWLTPHYRAMLDEIRETRLAASLEAAPDKIAFS